MLNPSSLEIMVEDIQIERRHEADLDRLAKTGRPFARFQERLGHFLMGLSSKEKELAQVPVTVSRSR